MSLKELTAEAHDQAETHPFVKLLGSGSISTELYAKYLYNQYIAYNALESFLTSTGVITPGLKGIIRNHNIWLDLHELNSDQSTYDNLQTPATLEYVNYISGIKEDPTKLLAHMYVRHMGDLSEGQLIASKVPGQGKFYRFDDVEALKEIVCSKLTDDLAEEAIVCFGFAVKLFDELMQ